MKLIDRLVGATVEKRYTFEDWLNDAGMNMLGYGQGIYTLPVQTTYGSSPVETIGGSFSSFVEGAYRANGVVFACVATRASVFSQARFQFTQRRGGMIGPFFGTADLALLESPWPNGTTADLLWRMEQDNSLAGNSFLVREAMAFQNRDRLTRLNPAHVQILLSSASYDAEVVGYQYRDPATDDSETFLVEDVCHWAPNQDPLASYRGMSWLQPIVQNVVAHNAARTHKIKFFQHGATPNLVVSMPKEVSRDEFDRFVERFRDQQQGVANAYKTLFLGAGADVQVVGSSLGQLDFKSTAGVDETQIALAARVPATILGISEGLAGSSLNAGNFGQSQRLFTDGYLHPAWDSVTASLASITNVPAGAELIADTREVEFCREDAKDAAEILQMTMAAIRQGVDAGFNPDAVVDACTSLDVSRLNGQHTNLFSVQLQPPVDGQTPTAPRSYTIDYDTRGLPIRLIEEDDGQLAIEAAP